MIDLIKYQKELAEEYQANIFISLGLFALAFVVIMVLVVLYFCMEGFRDRCCACCKIRIRELKEVLFFDTFIRYLIEGNLKLTFENFMFLAASASLGELPDRTTRTVVRVLIVIVMIVWIIFSMVFPVVKRDKLQDEDML